VWIATAAATGAIIMAMELTAFRLFAPFFGNSIYVWGSMISVVMLALAVGYGLGGWIADRARTDSLLYWIVLGSGAYQLGILFVTRPLLLKLWKFSDFAGTTLATLAIFAVPMAALAMTSPYVIRLLARAGHVGMTAGRVFAWSTAGSIAGVLGTTFWLVPRYGTRVAMEILCAAAIVIGAAGLMMRRKAAVVALLLLGVLFFVHAPAPSATLLWTGESAYNKLYVFESNGLRWLVLNDTHIFQTIEKVGSASSGFYLDQFALGPLVSPAKKLLVLGMGAGSSIRRTRAVAPEIDVDAVEIDPEVVRVAENFFDLPKNDAKLHVHVADARPWLEGHPERWDLVHVDLFQGGPYVPFYLTTVEFFELVRSRMTEDGVLMVNVFDGSEKKALLESIEATLQQEFPSVERLSTEQGNHIVFAFVRKREVAETIAQLKRAAGPDWVRELAQKGAEDIREVDPGAGTVIFTDDKAPVEEMTRAMLMESRK
jgi:spermidine synthase